MGWGKEGRRSGVDGMWKLLKQQEEQEQPSPVSPLTLGNSSFQESHSQELKSDKKLMFYLCTSFVYFKGRCIF